MDDDGGNIYFYEAMLLLPPPYLFYTVEDPSFVAEPEGKVAIKGESVNFTCSTTSSPRPAHINWLHKDRSVRTSHADNRYITEESTEVSGSFIFSSTLTLHDVSGEDSGFVECRSAGDSKDIFSLATLDVLGKC